MANNSRPVYSTESGRLCPDCGKPAGQCQCRQTARRPRATSQGITIWRERKGRAGKEVTLIRDLPLNPLELQMLASALKKHCGSGGTVRQGDIEIQGDHRESVRKYLQSQGYQAKLAGG